VTPVVEQSKKQLKGKRINIWLIGVWGALRQQMNFLAPMGEPMEKWGHLANDGIVDVL